VTEIQKLMKVVDSVAADLEKARLKHESALQDLRDAIVDEQSYAVADHEEA